MGAQKAAANRNKRAAKRYNKLVKSLKRSNKRSILKFNARVARGKSYFARRVKNNKKRAAFVVFQLRAKRRIVKLAARAAKKREARSKKNMKRRELRQKKHAAKVLKLNRHKESVSKAAKAAKSKARYQAKMEKANKMKEKAKKAKAAAAAVKAAAAAAKAEAAATKLALKKDATIASCPFTGPAQCQNKKKDPWMADDFVTCSWKKPKAAAADAGLAWAGFGGFGSFKETKFPMPAFKMPAMPKW